MMTMAVMESELLSILVCPQSKNKLELASQEIIKQVNDRIQQKQCANIGKENITEAYQEGLFEPQEKIFYPFMDGIPVLVYEKGIQLS